ncbi:MAG TPA: hypothetical protein PJ991_00800 [Kiritimatiellia bacterium]|nr:hypothetical protein [Kiritimatiellia bacterium]
MGIRLPSDWELLQFSSEFTRGRCAFADRYQFRLELSWSIVKGEPDYTRMISDYTSKLEQEKKLTGKELIKKAGWHGFFGEMNGELTSRFGRYLGEIGCLVECVVLWTGERDPDLEHDLVSSIRACPPHEGRQQWRAFGMHVFPPATAAFDGCVAQPARTEFNFTNPKSGNKWNFSRYGMVKSWLFADVESWLKSRLQTDARDLRFYHKTMHAVDVVFAEGVFKPEGIHLHKGELQAAAWIAPEDGRLYQVTQRLRKKHPGEQLPVETLLISAPEFTPRITS